MKDERKTKKDLIKELEKLRDRVGKLEKLDANYRQAEDALHKHANDLGERVKELNCLYGISHLVEKPGISLDEILRGTVDLIPPAWQYPEITCARIILDDQELRTENFREAPWKQASDIIVHGERVGTLDVCYLEERPESYEGPFLKEERSLINAIAERLGKIIERKKVEKALRMSHEELERRLEERTTECSKSNVHLQEETSERKRAEEALKESEARYRLLAENATDVIWVVDMNLQTTYISPSVMHLRGYTPEEVMAQSLEEILTPASLKATTEIFYEELAREEQEDNDLSRPLTLELEMRCKDGSTVWTETIGTFIHDEEGHPLGIHGVNRDITERKRTEEALRESEEKYRLLVEASTDAIFLETLEGYVLDCNRATCKMFGYEKEELVGLTVADLVPDEVAKILPDVITEHLTTGGIFIEARNKRKDGSIFPVEVSTRLINIGGQQLVIAHVRDITERKRAEEALIEYQEKLRSLASQLTLAEERERRRIATEVHDNLGQALALVQIKLDELRSSASSADIAELLDPILVHIERASEQARSLIFELSPPILYEFGLEAALEWLADKINEEHGLNSRLIDDGRPKPLKEDISVLLFQIVRELLVNVVKHARASNVIISMQRVNDNATVIVADDGVGAEKIERDSSDFTGGFGLFSIRERLRDIGGEFNIESEVGNGTRVTLSVPLFLEDEALKEELT